MIKSKDGMDEDVTETAIRSISTGTLASGRRILPCCEHAYLIEVVKSKLIDDGFSSIPSVSSNYDLLGEKFMDLRLSPKRYAQYLYIIIKVGDEPLTELEQGWFDYVHSLPNYGDGVVIDCVICRIPTEQLHSAMNGKTLLERLW